MKFFKSTSRMSRLRSTLEQLEPRLMLRSDVLPWGGDANLTLSFAPDGTRIGGMNSTLFASLSSVAATAEWQDAILRAFQTWAVETNASVGVVPDSGDNFGIVGASRRDPRFGDIRVGAAPLESGVFAIAIPAGDQLSGTWVGDVIFNSNAIFTDVADIFAVALHEAGHVFGLEHSDNPLSAMHEHGITPITTLASDDTDAIQALYGQPQPDLNELAKSNDTAGSPTQLRLNSTGTGSAGTAPSLAYGSLTSSTDVDYFRLPIPATYGGPVTITVRTKGTSLLAPELAIFDGKGVELGHAVSTASFGDAVGITINQMPSDGQLLIRVARGRSDVFGLGAYAIVATFDGLNAAAPNVVEQATNGALRFLPENELAKLFLATGGDTPDFNDDGHLDDDPSASVRLAESPGFPMMTRYETYASIADASDVDFYRVMSPAASGDVMTVRVRALEQGGLAPKITVYDKNGFELPAIILVNGAGECLVEVANVTPRSNLTISVSSTSRTEFFTTGNYQLSVAFGDKVAELQELADDSLTPAAPIKQTTLYVALPQLFDFGLMVPAAPATPNAVVMITIRDADDRVVYRVAASEGETRTAGSVLLKPGVYRVQAAVVAVEPINSALNFTVWARIASDPFAADPDDPTFQPEFQCDEPGHEGMYCYPGEFTSTDPYLWDGFIESLPDSPDQPYSPETIQLLLNDWWTWVWQQMGVDGPPLARNDVYKVTPNGGTLSDSIALVTSPNVLDNDFDPEQQTLQALLRTGTTHGSLNLNADGTFQYTPEAGFLGVDAFSYVASDLNTESSQVTVRITVGFRGDYDGDGAVSGADFLAWQRALGQATTPVASGSDGDGDGIVGSGDRLAWSDNFGDQLIVPSAVANGDFNKDGRTDGDDFLLWQRQLGTASLLGAVADGNGDGTVDQVDLTAWQDAFDSLASAPLSASSKSGASILQSAALVAVDGVDMLAGLPSADLVEQPMNDTQTYEAIDLQPLPIVVAPAATPMPSNTRLTSFGHFSQTASRVFDALGQGQSARASRNQRLDQAFAELFHPLVS
jgi:hypothetical protein